MNFQEHLEACQTINSFMGDLAYRYKASEYHQMWRHMDNNRDVFGDVFTAATIRKDPTAAELALIQPKKHNTMVEYMDPEEPEMAAGQRFHRVFPKENRRSIARKFVAMVVAGVALLVLITMILSAAAIDRSDHIIAGADAVIAMSQSGSR